MITRAVSSSVNAFRGLLLAALMPTIAQATTDNLGIVERTIASVRANAAIVPSECFATDVDPEQFLVIQDVCEAQGELALASVIQNAPLAPLEEAYLFLASQCIWIEVGYAETSRSVRVDPRIVSAFARAFDDIVLYHTHVIEPQTVAGALPAYSDLVGVLVTIGASSGKPNSIVRHRAVTRVGVFEYEIEQRYEVDTVIERLRKLGLETYMSQNLAYLYAGELREAEYINEVSKCAWVSDIETADYSDCFPLRSGIFAIHHREISAGRSPQ